MELLGCGLINTVKNVGKRITVQNKKVGEIFLLTKFQSMYETTDIHYTHVIDIQPARQFTSAMQNSKLLSLFISLQIDCFHSQ